MDEHKKVKNPIGIIWGWGKDEQNKFILCILLAVLGVICKMIPYLYAAKILASLITGPRDRQYYVGLCLMIGIGYLGQIAFSSVSTAVSHTATYYTLRDLRKKIVIKLAKVPMGTILDTPSAQFKTTIIERIEGMEPTLAHLFPEMTANLLVPIIVFIYLFYLDWRVALASVLSIVGGLMVMSVGMKNYPQKWEGAVLAGRRMNDAVLEYIDGIEVVKAFSQSAGSYGKYAQAVRYNADYYINWMKENQKVMSAYSAILPSVLVGVLPIGTILWQMGSLSEVTFITMILLSLAIAGPIMAAFTFTDDLAVLSTNVQEISTLLEMVELDRPVAAARLTDLTIELNQVSFSYHPSINVLENISFIARPGTVTALVGPSGSGKSTIAKLIAGFWDVSTGSITIGGIDTRNISLKQLYQQIAYVSQDNYLFDQSVKENIRLGNLLASDEQVFQAAIDSGCNEFICKLEQGYETVVGSAGSNLSGGERQRISIARAMLRDAPIIILDEATASIDPENEVIIQKALSQLTAGKTLIIIAHRLSTIADADQIVVLTDGVIEAIGNQQELLAQSQVYRKMWNAHLVSKDQEQEESENV